MRRADAWPWPELDAEGAAELVRPFLPDGARGPLAPAGEGDFCFAYRTGPWMVRVAKHGPAAAALGREACGLGRIAHRLPLEVPHPTLHEPHGCPPFTLHREVSGAALTRACWEGMPTAVRTGVAERLAAFLATLHGLTPAVDGLCNLPRLDEAALANRLRRAAGADLAGLLTSDVLGRLDEALAARTVRTDASRPPALLHCDIAPGHLLCDEDTWELSGVIDFGDMAIGPPARDFIFLYEDFGPALSADVLAAYARYATATAPTFADVRAWYLLEAVSWTLEMLATDRREDVAHGLGEITREVLS